LLEDVPLYVNSLTSNSDNFFVDKMTNTKITSALLVIGEAVVAAVEVAALEVVKNSTISVHAIHISKPAMQLQLTNHQERSWSVSHPSMETTDM
jgi:hypothetical protein